MSFIHLSVTSAYSLKYGTTQPADLVARASHFEMPALALTDRDGIFGAIRFARSCMEYGIAPIIGVNLAIDLFPKELRAANKDEKRKLPRLTLLAHGDGGWRALVRFLSGVRADAGERIPVITRDHLQRYSEYAANLYALHGPQSPLSQALALHRPDIALDIFNQSRDFFGDHAIECVSHLGAGSGPGSTAHAARSLIFARDHDIDAIITNAVRMERPEDGPLADILDCARQRVPLHSRHLERSNAEAYLKPTGEMHRLAEEIARAAGERSPRALLKSTRQWAERSLLSPTRDLSLGAIHLPEAEVVGASDGHQMRALLRSRCEAGVNWRYSDNALLLKARARLDDELATVATLGYESYFLTVADVTDMARARGIRVAARGSGAGSLITHALGISGVDPIAHGLLMERFCSPLRRALPDIDIDVESARRLEIYDAVFERYGAERWDLPGVRSRCATVSMVETYRARHAIRDAGAALGLPAGEIDLLAKAMPHIRARNIKHALENLPELRTLNTRTPLATATLEMASRLDGLPRNIAMHPCAVVLSDGALLDRVPVLRSAAGYPMVEFDKDDVEEIGLLKLDILGVRMQSTLAYSVEEIKRVDGVDIDLDAQPLDDAKTFDLISSTKTLGLFQIESPGQRELIGKLVPRTFNDLIIDISLFRPGPVKSDMIRPFLEARHGWAQPRFIHRDLRPVLEETNGVVVFHEQVISIIAILGGISLAAADEKRRALGSPEGQQEVCDWFFPAATARGYELSVIHEAWEVLRAFASFGFCKAHAAAFALPTYQSAWLKTHYPAHFLAGVLTHDPGMYPKRLMLDEARQMGIALAPIDINYSMGVYAVEKREEGYAIRIALSAVAGISEREITSIIAARPYVDLGDFYKRSGASTPVVEALIMTGALDEIYQEQKINRRDLLLHFHDLLQSPQKPISGAQMALTFPAPDLAPSGLPDLKEEERLAHEIEHLGMDISEHALSGYSSFLNAIGAVRSSDLLKQRSGSSVLVAGIRVALQTPPMRSGKRVIFLTLDDGYGCSDSTFFTDVQGDYAGVLYSARILLVRGVIRRTGERGVSLRATGAWDLRQAYEQWRAKAAI